MPVDTGVVLLETAHLTPDEFGAYFRLFIHHWKHRGLPDDDKQLRILSGFSRHRWVRSRAKILRIFTD